MVDDKTHYTIHIKPTFPHSTKVYLVHKTKLTCLSLSHQYKIPLMNKRSAHKANLSPSTIICCTTYQHAYTRARRRFSFLAFTSSPNKDKKLMNNNLSVKAKEDLPSPVKYKKALHLHPQITNYQSIRGKGEG